MAHQLAPEVRGVMIPLTETRLLLPNASVSEVITFSTPQAIPDAPDWVFGIINWRGWRLPLFSFSLLSEAAENENTLGAKVAILKAFGGIHRMPYMALLAQGFPRLTTVTNDNLILETGADLPEGVLHSVSVNDEAAYIPDLDSIEAKLLTMLD